MVIDDDPLQVEFLETIFLSEGYRVDSFIDSKKALARALSDQPDIIVTDLSMPEMDGFELVRRLKADESTRAIPIILVTAWNDQYAESEGFQLGAVDYITKPFSPPVVKARVRAQLELKQHRDGLEHLVQVRTAELTRSRRQFKDLVEKSLVGIAIFIDQRIDYYNPELRRIIRNLDLKVANKDLSFLHPDDWPKIEQAYHALVEHRRQRMEIDFRIVQADDSTASREITWVNCRAVRFTYRQRNAILANVVDITHAKEMERQLLIRNKMASLGRIASGMAHEIRNPLTGITAYLYSLEQLLVGETLSSKDIALMTEIVEQLKSASKKVDAVIKRVLDFAKPAAPHMAPVDLNQCVENMVKLTEVTFREAGIDVQTTLASNLPKCHADATLIEQVILNLFQNAVRAAGLNQGEKHVAIRTFCQRGYVLMDLSDSGEGVPADLREKVFDPFFTTHPDGSGIGLSIAQRIMTDHRGHISVQDSELGGAKFTISIPFEKRNLK